MKPLERKRAAFKLYQEHKALAVMQIPEILRLTSPLTTREIQRQAPTLQKQAIESAISYLKMSHAIREIPFKGYALIQTQTDSSYIMEEDDPTQQNKTVYASSERLNF